MNNKFKFSKMAIKVVVLFIGSAFSISQAQEKSGHVNQIANKPLVLDVRYCSCQAIDIESDTMELMPNFLEESDSIKVGVAENDSGFVSAGGLTFGYSFVPDKEAGTLVLNYSSEYLNGERFIRSQSSILVDLSRWIYISGYQGKESFNMAIKLTESELNL